MRLLCLRCKAAYEVPAAWLKQTAAELECPRCHVPVVVEDDCAEVEGEPAAEDDSPYESLEIIPGAPFARAHHLLAEPFLSPAPMPLPEWERIVPGTLVGGIIVGKLIAEGGAGAVYRAIAPDGSAVAIKVLHRALSEHPMMRQRFQQEAQLLARIHHPNVVRHIDHGELLDRRLYLVMELVSGPALRERMSEDVPMTTAEAFGMFSALCEALEVVHAAGIVHRDVKPENVILCRRRNQAKLIDFGIAKALDGPNTDLHTRNGALLGSPAYVAPEQIEGAGVDPRTDLYGLGLVLYEVLTDAWPWSISRMDEWRQLRAHVELPPRLDERLARRSPELASIVMRCLEKDPALRPSSAAEVRAVIEAAQRHWPLPFVGNPDIYSRLALPERERGLAACTS